MFTKVGSMLPSNKVKLPIHLHFPRLCSFAFQDEFSCGHVRFEGPGNTQVEMYGKHKAARRVVWARVSSVSYAVEWRSRSSLENF